MSKDQESEFDRLITDSADGFEGESPSPSPAKSTWTFSRKMLVGLLAAETIALTLVIFALFARHGAPQHPTCIVPLGSQGVLYSPALDVVENEAQVYYVGFPGDLSPFQIPSSPALDQAWSDLYNFGISRITHDEAAKLPNKTHAIPGDDGHYIAELDVFHTLHCLVRPSIHTHELEVVLIPYQNKVRMALDPDYYPDWRISTTNNWIPSQKNATEHVSIQCAGDTSVIVWQWDDFMKASIVKGNIAHTCRKFDKLQDWGRNHMLLNVYDPSARIEDDIVVPVFHNEI
ncbi:hypothetical protein DFH09DRAFT_1089878 [Mycena vulgaris]|nr:hypothetical protein DFH09DRAFT_1089878 [Mycena vulgaris]